MRIFNRKITVKTKYFLILPFIIPILSLIGRFGIDNDFWFTINQGRYVLENGFPTNVIGTIHEGLSFIYQSYGTGILFYLIYKWFGEIGIIILITLLVELIIYIFYKLCLLISDNNNISILLTTIFTILFSAYITTRPHLFTVLNLLLIIYLFELYIKKKNKKYLFFIPLIGIMQANMHGIYFVPLLIIISPYVINSFKYKIKSIESKGYNYKPILITYLITTICGLINYNTYKVFTYGFTSYGNSVMSEKIVELRALNFHDFFGKLCIITILITYIIYFINKDKKIPIRYYLLLFGTTYLAFDAFKSFYFFLVCTLFPIAYMYKKNNEFKHEKKVILITLIPIIILLPICIMFTKVNKPDVIDIADYLDNNNQIESPKLYTSFMDGSYLEYRGYNCYLDPRAELFIKSNNKKKDILEEWFDVQKGKISYKKFLSEYDFDYLVIKKENDIFYYNFNNYDSMNYKKVFDNDKYELWKKDV